MRALFGVLGALALAALIAVPAYLAGVSAGPAQVALPVASAVPGTVYTAHWIGYGAPFHFFGLLFPLVFLFVLIALAKGFGGGWRRGWYPHGDVPQRVEDWHNRLHLRKDAGGSGPAQR